MSAAERAAPPGALLLVDADLRGDVAPLLPSDKVSQGLRIAAFAEREGGGFGLAKGAARALIRLRSGLDDGGAALGAARSLAARARRRLSAGTRLRGGDAHDDRRGERRDSGRRGRALPAAPCDRPRRARLPAPRPPAARRAAGGRPVARELPRRPPAARRLDGRAPRAVDHRDRPRGRPLERGGTRLPRAPARAANDRRAQARRDPARRAGAHAFASRARCSSPCRRTLSTSSTRVPAAPSRRTSPLRSWSTRRSRSPSCSRPTIFAR